MDIFLNGYEIDKCYIYKELKLLPFYLNITNGNDQGYHPSFLLNVSLEQTIYGISFRYTFAQPSCRNLSVSLYFFE